MTAMKVLGLVLMAVVPGGLVVLAAFVLARLVASRMRELEGTQHLKLARAVSRVSWREVWRETRRVL